MGGISPLKRVPRAGLWQEQFGQKETGTGSFCAKLLLPYLKSRKVSAGFWGVLCLLMGGSGRATSRVMGAGSWIAGKIGKKGLWKRKRVGVNK